MKKILSPFLAVIITANIIAQVPEKISYQAVVRNASNVLVSNSSIGVQISIIQGSPTGTALFVERHFPSTNQNGLVSLEIGGGLLVSGSLTAIDWSAASSYIKTEIDLNGGANYTISGTTQILSVPYAMNTKIAESAKTADYNNLTNKPALFSGNYNDLSNKPVLGVKSAALINDILTITDAQGNVKVNLASLKNDTVPFPGSVILSKNDQIMVNNMIGNPNQKWTLAYRKSRDGASSTTYHNLCDLRGPTVSIIKLSNGYILGGYAKTSIRGSISNYFTDTDAFIFSVTNRLKFPLAGADDNLAVYFHTNYGPTFGGGHDITVNNTMSGGYCNFPYTYAYNGTYRTPSNAATQILSGTNTGQAFVVNEVEVWIQGY